jgi:hypothetical protein
MNPLRPTELNEVQGADINTPWYDGRKIAILSPRPK